MERPGHMGITMTQTEQDSNGNSAIGPNIKLIETKNCIVHTMGEKKVVVQGLDGYIIAEEDGRLLICKISEEQRIKEFSE